MGGGGVRRIDGSTDQRCDGSTVRRRERPICCVVALVCANRLLPSTRACDPAWSWVRACCTSAKQQAAWGRAVFGEAGHTTTPPRTAITPPSTLHTQPQAAPSPEPDMSADAISVSMCRGARLSVDMHCCTAPGGSS